MFHFMFHKDETKNFYYSPSVFLHIRSKNMFFFM